MNAARDPNETPRPRSDAEMASRNRRAATFWGALVVGLLGIQVLVGVGAVVIATSDPSASIVPDYYEKALRWDDEKAARLASDALGWEATVRLSPAADRRGDRTVVVSILDASGDPVADAEVRGRVYHHARAADAMPIALRRQGDGHYTATAPVARGGLWQFDLTATRRGAEATSAEAFQICEVVEVESDGESTR